MGINPKTTIGRADLAWLFFESCDEPQRDAFVRLCGFETEETEEATEIGAPATTSAGTGEKQVSEPLSVSTETFQQARLGFWRIVRAELAEEEARTEAPPWFRDSEPISREFLKEARLQPEERPFPHLVPWPRLWPFLRRELSLAAPGRKVDADALIRQIARCRPIRKIPRRRVLRWANEIHLLYDTSDPLRTFFTDMQEVVDRLSMICGRHMLKIFAFPQGVAATGYRCGRPPGIDSLLSYRAPDQPTTVLALSDLGSLTEDRETGRWAVDLGHALARSGSRAIALLPCPPWRWRPGLRQTWRLAQWETGMRPHVETSISTPDRPEKAPDRKSAGLSDLLRLMSPVVRPDPELIRYIRSLLPAEQTDAGMEADIWMQRYDYQMRLAEFSSELPLALRQNLVDLLEWFHGNYPEVLAEELTIIESADPRLTAGLKRRADKINAMLAVSLEDRRWQAEGFIEEEFIGYIKRREGRLPPEAYQDPRIAVAWVLDHRTDEGQLDTKLIPAFLPVDEVAWALKPRKKQPYRLSQVRQSIMATPEGQTGAGHVSSPLGILPTSTELVFVKPLSGQEVMKQPWSVRGVGPEILDPREAGKRYRIEAPGAVLELEQITRPGWAREMGRDRHGLFVRLFDARRFYWLSPGRYEIAAQAGASSIQITEGFWLKEERFREHLSTGLLTPAWEAHLAEDRFGLYEVIFIFGVRQAFRWIPPGRFMMGSPDSEPERLDNELQHEVELSRGFWLADTACTQTLWEAVMGKNPSRFKGVERPVEKVSWDDCRAFIRRINETVPGLSLRLPTETQWEYACRAGTTTPFWFGNTITPEQVNYDGNYPYAGGAKGVNRNETVPVRTLPPNSWGLYEMHGNVREWCSDWYGPYEARKAVDPRGPNKGEYRVLRGGSWFSLARSCRSADRDRLRPGSRIGYTGFRISRGQEAQEPEQDRPQKKGAAPRTAQMKFQFFSINALNPTPGQEELNRFCAAHNLVSVEKQFVPAGPNSYWAVYGH